ncbi:MAG TPA: hypothetical protein VMV10_17050 [Pirellulales bacterium]|nr:hypothetical protein [Pirellulales bacterium]
MPKDPLARDWAERLNRYAPRDLPDAPGAKPTPRQHAPQVDAARAYCCEAPDLQWTGDPELPGVACLNCGYTVADCGSVVMYPAPDVDEEADDPGPMPQQQELFGDD